MKITNVHVNKVLGGSHRDFIVFFSGTQPSGHPTTHSLQAIITFSLQDDYEWAHALCERLDDLLDLVIAESMIFYPNRDDKDKRREVAIIKRIR